MTAAENTDRMAAENAEYAEANAADRALQLFARLLPSREREAIVGDLLEDAAVRNIVGRRRALWLATECGAIAAGLTLTRVRGWLVVPPMRELAAGLALDGRGVLRGGHPLAAAGRALIFCGSIATLVLGVALLVSTLLSAAGLR